MTCIGGHLLGTASEFYQRPGTPPPPAPGDDRATIVIKVFATPFVQPIMHNEVRVDPDNEIAEVNELNNFAFQNTTVGVGNGDKGAFNQLTIDKTQSIQRRARAARPGVPASWPTPNRRCPERHRHRTTSRSRTSGPTRSARSSSRTSCRPARASSRRATPTSGRACPTRSSASMTGRPPAARSPASAAT